jgi:hypothetical protein
VRTRWLPHESCVHLLHVHDVWAVSGLIASKIQSWPGIDSILVYSQSKVTYPKARSKPNTMYMQ